MELLAMVLAFLNEKTMEEEQEQFLMVSRAAAETEHGLSDC